MGNLGYRVTPEKGDNASMTAQTQTLLAKLAPKFRTNPEDLAVEALGHILSESKSALRTLSNVIEEGGANVGEIDLIRTQATGKEGERPDLAGRSRDGRERVLIEAKFWAGLTGNQPVAYLERLPSNMPSALLFVAPAARIETLWNELQRSVARSQSGITLAQGSEVKELRSANAGGSRYLLLTSWQALLGRMATQAAAASEWRAEKDIEQLRGLAAQQDDEAFLPLRREELGPDFPRRMIGLRRLINEAIDRAINAKFASKEDRKVVNQESGYGQYVRLAAEARPWLGFNFNAWVSYGETPLWLCFWYGDLEQVHRALEPLRQKSPSEIFYRPNHSVVVPVELPVGVEYDEVRDAVVKRLKEVADLIRAADSS